MLTFIEIIGLGLLAVAENGKGVAAEALRAELIERGALPAPPPPKALFDAPKKPQKNRITWKADTDGYVGTGWRFPDGKLDELRAAYPAVTMDAELRHADQWLKTPGKTKKDHHGFLVRWLGKAQDKPRRAGSGNPSGLGPFQTVKELYTAVVENAPCRIEVNGKATVVRRDGIDLITWHPKSGLIHGDLSVMVKAWECRSAYVFPVAQG